MRKSVKMLRSGTLENSILPLFVGVAALSNLFVFGCLVKSQAATDDEAIRMLKKITYRPLASSAESEKGKQFYERLTCANCHSVGGDGGTLGPPLDAVGGVRDEEAILSRISQSAVSPKDSDRIYGIPELMAHPRLPAIKAEAVAKYLLTLPAPAEDFEIRAHKIMADEIGAPKNFQPSPMTLEARKGAKLFSDQGCASCHSVDSVGGWFGPALDGIGARRSRAYIAAQVLNPEANVVRTRRDHIERPSMMPRLQLRQKDVDRLTAFLLTLPASGK